MANYFFTPFFHQPSLTTLPHNAKVNYRANQKGGTKMAKRNIILVFLVIMAIVSNFGKSVFRRHAQHSKPLWEFMLVLDAMDFIYGGGGEIGYDNFWKWNYARGLKAEDRLWVRLFFWDRGIFYDATNPPERYAYEPRFD